jgi:hypothetical protein
VRIIFRCGLDYGADYIPVWIIFGCGLDSGADYIPVRIRFGCGLYSRIYGIFVLIWLYV